MYNEINTLIKNDLNNYNKRHLTKSTISYDDLQTIAAYTRLWANDERNCNEALHIAKCIDKKLYDHIECVTGWHVEVTIYDDFIDLLEELRAINEALNYEEASNLGFGKEARLLRKKWRAKLREAHKHLDKCVHNHILWIKEHRRPRTIYVLGATGECHNGLYWTIRELMLHPKYIKYGFTKEV